MKRIVLAGIVVIAMTADLALASNFRTISHDGWGFRQSLPFGLNGYNSKQVSKKDGYPVRFGEKSERFEVRPGDCSASASGSWNDCANDRERSEMTSIDTTMFNNGDEYWYRWSIYFPEKHVNLYPVWMTYGQFKQVGCDPVFTFIEADWSGGKYGVGDFGSYMTSAYVEPPNGRRWMLLDKDYKGKWIDIVVHAKWSYTNDGIFRVWMNGKLKRDHRGQTLFCHDGIYFKYGIYRSSIMRAYHKSSTITTIVYYDGIRISRTKDGMFEPLSE